MASSSDTTNPLLPEHHYHIFNQGNGKINIFYQPENYAYYLRKYEAKISPWVDTYTFCLLPNHFHFQIRVKPTSELLELVSLNYSRMPKLLYDRLRIELGGNFPSYSSVDNYQVGDWISQISPEYHEHVISWIISDQFRRFFMGYAKAINQQEGRSGSLFRKPFRRKLIDGEGYFRALVWYIHNNSRHHHLCTNFEEYPWSSYAAIVSETSSLLDHQTLLKWVGGIEAFLRFHAEMQVDKKLVDKVAME